MWLGQIEVDLFYYMSAYFRGGSRIWEIVRQIWERKYTSEIHDQSSGSESGRRSTAKADDFLLLLIILQWYILSKHYFGNLMWNSAVMRGASVVCLSVVCLSVVCVSSVTLVHPTQAVVVFSNISTALGTLAIHWHP